MEIPLHDEVWLKTQMRKYQNAFEEVAIGYDWIKEFVMFRYVNQSLLKEEVVQFQNYRVFLIFKRKFFLINAPARGAKIIWCHGFKKTILGTLSIGSI